MTENLPAKENTLFRMLQDPALKKQMQLAIPKHMTVDRLLRVAMTAIRTTPKLMDCTPKSLMSCIMACAQLGLEPEPFLGQAYFVPFKVNVAPKGNPAKWELRATFIPGYRGYISMARRSGEVQSVTAQAVYSNDEFRVQYGLIEELYHIPADEQRGDFKGAYVIFRYKDGSHSFDWMTKGRIEKVRERSKAKDSGPWVTDYDEMAVKTVIRHHVKLVPLSVEMAKAAHLEEKAIIGEDQAGLIFGEAEQGELIEGTQGSVGREEESISDKFERLAQGNGILDVTELKKLLADSAKATGRTEDDLMAAACADFPKFLDIFNRSLKQKKEREEMEAKAAKAKKKAAEPKATATDQEENPIDRARRMKGEKQKEGATLESEWGEAKATESGPFPEDPPAGAETIDPGTGEVLPGNGDNGFFVVCSDKNGDEMTKGYCRTACVKYKGHPVDCKDYQSESI